MPKQILIDILNYILPTHLQIVSNIQRVKLSKYMDISESIAALSKDTGAKVGAIIIDNYNTIRSTGYNGAPRGCDADEIYDSRSIKPEKYYWVAHAECNAIFTAARVGTPLKGCTIITTHTPCTMCAKAIVQSGIVKVVTKKVDESFETRWKNETKRSLALFRETGVQVVFLVE